MIVTEQDTRNNYIPDLHTVKGRLCAQKIEIALLCLSIIGFVGAHLSSNKSMFCKGGNHVCGALLATSSLGLLLLIIQQTCQCFGKTFLKRIRVDTDQVNGQERFHIVTLQ